MKYRKKPVVIEAVQWNGNPIEVQRFCQTAKVEVLNDAAWKVGIAAPSVKVVVPTLEGDMEVSFGDFVIKGVNGEFYPCKPDVFKKTYEPVDEVEEDEDGRLVVLPCKVGDSGVWVHNGTMTPVHVHRIQINKRGTFLVFKSTVVHGAFPVNQIGETVFVTSATGTLREYHYRGHQEAGKGNTK